MEEDALLKISELAESAGVMASTIRHYTDLGLLRVAGYTDGGHRLYSSAECRERVSRIQLLSKRGLTLPQIRQELEGKVQAKKILVVDDEQESVDVIMELLHIQYPQWQVDTAMDGFTAGRKLLEFLPDIVVLDLMLPGIDGFSICKSIRKDPNLMNTKIIAITGYDTAEMKQKIFDAGANDYLAKPMEPIILMGKIKTLLGIQ